MKQKVFQSFVGVLLLLTVITQAYAYNINYDTKPNDGILQKGYSYSWIKTKNNYNWNDLFQSMKIDYPNCTTDEVKITITTKDNQTITLKGINVVEPDQNSISINDNIIWKGVRCEFSLWAGIYKNRNKTILEGDYSFCGGAGALEMELSNKEPLTSSCDNIPPQEEQCVPQNIWGYVEDLGCWIKIKACPEKIGNTIFMDVSQTMPPGETLCEEQLYTTDEITNVKQQYERKIETLKNTITKLEKEIENLRNSCNTYYDSCKEQIDNIIQKTQEECEVKIKQIKDELANNNNNKPTECLPAPTPFLQDDNCANYDFMNGILSIPCFKAGGENYWLKFKMMQSTNRNEILMKLEDYGKN